MNSKTIKLIFTIILFVSTNIILIGQPQDFPFRQEPGKCYAKCMIPDQYEEIKETFLVYVGEHNTDLNLDTLYFQKNDLTGELKYIGYVEELNQRQQELVLSFESIIILLDGEENEEYIEEEISYVKFIKKGGHAEWREVLCGNKIDARKLNMIQNALTKEGYLEEQNTLYHMTKQMKTALIKYQKDRRLPVGNLDIETLESLGINY